MIHYIYSNLQSFKELSFHEGLNILLADKSPGATERQTRNGAGKTSLIELIHFLTGADCGKDSIFRVNALVNSSFGMDFDLAGIRTIVERMGKNPGKLTVIAGETSNWPIAPSLEKKTGRLVISNTNWKKVLGCLMFGLTEGEDEEQFGNKFGPTFRSLFSYFVRRQNSGAFMSPVKHANMQQLWDVQVAISFLLGLDWTIAQQWQVVREREKTLKELRKAVQEGAFGAVIGTAAELRTKLAVAEERVRRLRENVNSFRVLPEYRELEVEASEITRQLGRLADENTMDHKLIADLEESLAIEIAPSFDALESLYKEAGVVLPGAVIRRFEEVRAFHEAVIENRKSYLKEEIEEARQRIVARERSMHDLSERRAEILEILKSHGALEHFTKLQSELSRVEAEMEALRQQFMVAEQLEGGKTELDIERRRLEVRLRQDYHEQSEALRRAILIFEEISNQLYENAGSLIIKESFNGPLFEVKIQGAKSKGINNMQIFCFDMMLMRLCAERGIGPGFLVHDSHLFDGVDERQVARALYIGANTANKFGFQYIVTMNSDVVPKQFPDGFKLEDYILPVRLTDATEDGGLFGVRF